MGVGVATWLAVIDGDSEPVCALLAVPVELSDAEIACDCVDVAERPPLTVWDALAPCVALGELVASCEALLACELLAVIGVALGDSVRVADND